MWHARSRVRYAPIPSRGRLGYKRLRVSPSCASRLKDLYAWIENPPYNLTPQALPSFAAFVVWNVGSDCLDG
jgi:hypothetical protein